MADDKRDDEDMLPVNDRGRLCSGQDFDELLRDREAALNNAGASAPVDGRGRCLSGEGVSEQGGKITEDTRSHEDWSAVDNRGNRLDPKEMLRDFAGEQKQPRRIGGSIFRNLENTRMPRDKKGSPWPLLCVLLFFCVGLTMMLVISVPNKKAQEPILPKNAGAVDVFVKEMPSGETRVNFIKELGEERLEKRVFVCRPEERK